MADEPWIQTHTGVQFFLLSPTTEEIHKNDIAHALAHLCRFNGHSSEFYSVAEHSVLMAEYALGPLNRGVEFAMACLLHDAAEAYIGDYPRPMKLVVPELKDIETVIQHAVAGHFGLPLDTDTLREVDEIDKRILIDEWTQLFDRTDLMPKGDDMRPLHIDLRYWSPPTAKFEFLTLLANLELIRQVQL